MRRRGNSEVGLNLDSLLDTLTNVIGFLIILLILMRLGVNQAVERIRELDPSAFAITAADIEKVETQAQAKADELANEIGDRFPATKVSVGYPENTSGSVDLILNATSLGLKGDDPLPLDESQFNLSHAEAVFDMIYQPAETPQLVRAKAAGCRTANGLGMLLWQGAKALEIWTGQAAPVEVMRDALTAHIYGDE